MRTESTRHDRPLSRAAARRPDTSQPSPARVYNYLLGGKDNYAVDQEVAHKSPDFFRDAALQNRAFMRRAVKWVASTTGIEQFLDVGTGIPTDTGTNLHEIVQSINPRARVVYADNDPIVMAHAQALLVSASQGSTNYLQVDLRRPEVLLQKAQEYLDFTCPVALSLIAVLHFITDDQDPYGIVRTLVEALPSGSYLTISHGDVTGFPDDAEGSASYGKKIPSQFRTREEVAGFFDGLDLLPPGLVMAHEWHQQPLKTSKPKPGAIWVGVARTGSTSRG
ncbi:SAM-dependent methyltransferase [Streptomyces sp. 8L]|uniref:SAM-dependent methyltransferase n=1 Tax=Streptomyces sp. 8L TaxID=2877242 RepID=UPI001CD30C29|nr:SAM-dependent methyltransferase [Streptomyces sp. 8L]MCA1223264.1 SAM-dependent methyltransferase [Streptomyces sp. 8L]